jgi:hypothetical protein
VRFGRERFRRQDRRMHVLRCPMFS